MIKKCQSHNGSPRFLIIEDELLIVDLMADMTRALGYTVTGTANTLSSAYLALCKKNFDAVLLDLGIDGECGSEIADRLLEMRVPFAFVTGYDGLFEEQYACLPLLRKPFSVAQFARLLEKLAGPAVGRQPADKPGQKRVFENGTVVFI